MLFAPTTTPVFVGYEAVHVSEFVPAVQVAATEAPLPTTKLTVPAGATPTPVTVAVNVAFWPSVPATFGTETVGATVVTTCLSTGVEVDVAKVVVPPYETEIA